MTSLRQIEANRRNARLSTGPITEVGKKRSRQNALRHGLTAETVIGTMENASDYAAFELAITRDFEATTAVERELVLRLASVLWRLRRATAIESGLFEREAQQHLRVQPNRCASNLSNQSPNNVVGIKEPEADGTPTQNLRRDNPLASEEPPLDQVEGDDDRNGPFTQSFVALVNLPGCPLDRLNRYEAMLWRQAVQLHFALQMYQCRPSWKRTFLRSR